MSDHNHHCLGNFFYFFSGGAGVGIVDTQKDQTSFSFGCCSRCVLISDPHRHFYLPHVVSRNNAQLFHHGQPSTTFVPFISPAIIKLLVRAFSLAENKIPRKILNSSTDYILITEAPQLASRSSSVFSRE